MHAIITLGYIWQHYHHTNKNILMRKSLLTSSITHYPGETKDTILSHYGLHNNDFENMQRNKVGDEPFELQGTIRHV